jgi:hypothetical protein
MPKHQKLTLKTPGHSDVTGLGTTAITNLVAVRKMNADIQFQINVINAMYVEMANRPSAWNGVEIQQCPHFTCLLPRNPLLGIVAYCFLKDRAETLDRPFFCSVRVPFFH